MSRITGRAWAVVLRIGGQERLVRGGVFGPALYQTKGEARAVLRWTRRMYRADAGEVRRVRYTVEAE